MIDVFLIVICLGFPLLWGLWRLERRRIAEETRRKVMASVMDAQNNLLNNIVYFRTRAETSGTVSATELLQIDCAVRETQSRLIEIAEAELNESRDLGGIRVLSTPKAKLVG